MAALPRDTGDVGGDRVDAAKVVQQPRVEAVRFQGGAHGGQIECFRSGEDASTRHASSIDPAPDGRPAFSCFNRPAASFRRRQAGAANGIIQKWPEIL